jgi:putative ABC transport system ATP-binding protein
LKSKSKTKAFPLIEVKNLNKDFVVGKSVVSVLKNINIEIYPGEFVIIFGPSGCGKSTLLNTLIGLEKPTSGKIMFEGENIYTKNDDEKAILRRNKFGMIYQQASWIKSLNIIENIAFPLHIRGHSIGKSKKRAKNVMELLGMSEFENYLPVEISGGQQQKISMCRALITNPDVIIADEPTGNLDTISALDVMNIFKFINDESGKTIIMVTHNLEYEKFASKVIYIRDGEVQLTDIKKKIEPLKEDNKKDLLEIALET